MFILINEMKNEMFHFNTTKSTFTDQVFCVSLCVSLFQLSTFLPYW
uniref:Uncharacterized protein n=1 Tax=Anguilla anguilla TaxID=7936 RepID=A0A0E9U324_ANGAN